MGLSSVVVGEAHQRSSAQNLWLVQASVGSVTVWTSGLAWVENDCSCFLNVSCQTLAGSVNLTVGGSGCVCLRQHHPLDQRGVVIFSVTLLEASSGQRSECGCLGLS